jgi:putative Ca2+/H+ antiporter (TMEM165/GDT1 family)
MIWFSNTKIKGDRSQLTTIILGAREDVTGNDNE